MNLKRKNVVICSWKKVIKSAMLPRTKLLTQKPIEVFTRAQLKSMWDKTYGRKSSGVQKHKTGTKMQAK